MTPMNVPNIGKSQNKRRHAMPQIASRYYNDFFKWLKNKHDITYRKESVQTKSLKPTQKEFHQEKIDSLKKNRPAKLKSPILVSKNGFILDGHHRWLTLHQETGKVSIIRFSEDIDTFLDIAKDYPNQKTRKLHEFVEYVKAYLNDDNHSGVVDFSVFMEAKQKKDKEDKEDKEKKGGSNKKNPDVVFNPDEQELDYET